MGECLHVFSFLGFECVPAENSHGVIKTESTSSRTDGFFHSLLLLSISTSSVTDGLSCFGSYSHTGLVTSLYVAPK